MLTDKEERAIGKSLLVHGSKGGRSSSGFFKADESTILFGLNMSGLDFTVFGKHCGQFSVIGTGREALHEKVGELSFDTTTFASLVFGLM